MMSAKRFVTTAFRLSGFSGLLLAVIFFWYEYDALAVLMLLYGWFGFSFASHLERIRYR
jgi:asparagine N-glycosylation enzyme membrane subunit Stt3